MYATGQDNKLVTVKQIEPTEVQTRKTEGSELVGEGLSQRDRDLSFIKQKSSRRRGGGGLSVGKGEKKR